MPNTNRPEWLVNYLRYRGIHEMHGNSSNPIILELLDRADGSDDGKNLQNIHDDETPYCSSALCGNFEELGFTSPRSAMARSWEHWGVHLIGPALGCVVVFWRGSRSGSNGHVGLVAGRDQHGNLVVFGANQGDQFKYSNFDTERVLSYRWPEGEPLPEFTNFRDLPVVDSDGKLSTNEA
jgi:uncharacterized protein (TIGR02594 family)